MEPLTVFLTGFNILLVAGIAFVILFDRKMAKREKESQN